MEKGYIETDSNDTIRSVGDMDRNAMLAGNKKKNQALKNCFGCSMITGFSNQYFAIKKIFQKYWNILNDKILGPVIPDQPVVMFRGAPSLRHKIAPNVIDPPNTISFFHTMKGFFPGQKCKICQVNHFQGRKYESFQFTLFLVYDFLWIITFTHSHQKIYSRLYIFILFYMLIF